jgi:hypothetical protein
MRSTQRETSGLLETSTEVDLKQQDNGIKQRELQAHEILPRLGVDAVLLPVGSKKNPIGKGWQKRRYDQTQTPQYQEKLKKSPAIGVLLGAASQGLCSIDCDCDQFKSELLKQNPRLRVTLQTQAKRGCNLWVVVEGEIPPTRKLTSNGKPLGEWRSNGGHTVIAGVHPEGVSYRVCVDKGPIRLRYEEIVWPENDQLGTVLLPPPPPSSVFSVSSVSSVYYGDKTPRDLSAKIKAENVASRQLSPVTQKQYRRWIEKVHTATQGSRNSSLVAMIPFLIRAVGRRQLSKLYMAFYDLNQSIFTDSQEQHQTEAESHAEACMESWLEGLSQDEREIYESLPEDYQESFRICRDLGEKSKNGIFHLSCRELAERISKHDPHAHKIFRTFQEMGIICMIEKGSRGGTDPKRNATVWKWVKPL